MVAEPKTAKNRLHFDLRAPGPVAGVEVVGPGQRDESVRRVRDIPDARAGMRGVEVDERHRAAVAEHTVVGRDVAVADDLSGLSRRQVPGSARGLGEAARRVVEGAQ